VPERIPVAAFRARPAGSAPLEIDQLYGGVPPLTAGFSEKNASKKAMLVLSRPEKMAASRTPGPTGNGEPETDVRIPVVGFREKLDALLLNPTETH
jgi:hypothetical protein